MDLASLTLTIESQQAAKAAADLSALERSSQSAERASLSLSRQFESLGRVTGSLERAYQRVDEEIESVAEAQRELDRSAAASGVSVNRLGELIQKSAEQFTKFGAVSLAPVQTELKAAEARLIQLTKEAQDADDNVTTLDQATLDSLTEEVARVRTEFDKLKASAEEAADFVGRQAADLIKSFNLEGQPLSRTFEVGVQLNNEEQIQAIERETERRRLLIATVETQLQAQGRLDEAARAEIERSRELTDRYREQSLQRVETHKDMLEQAQGAVAASGAFGQLIVQLRGLALAYTAFISSREAVASALEFEASQSALRGVVKELTGELGVQSETFEQLEESAKRAGLTSQFSGTVIARAYNQMLQAGIEARDSILGVEAAMDLAEAQNISLSQAIDIVSRSMRQFGLDGAQAAGVTDSIVNVAIRTQAELSQLAFNLTAVGPSARQAGFELEEMAAAIGALGQLRGKGQQAPLVLKEFIEALTRPSKDAQEELERLRIGLDELSPRSNSLVDILKRLESANLSTASSSKIFGENVSFTVPFLIQQRAEIERLVRAQESGVGVTERLAEANSDSLKGSLEELKSAFQTFAGSGAGAAGALSGFVDSIADVIRMLAGLDDELVEANDGARAFTDAVRALVSPIGLTVAAVTALTGAYNALSSATFVAKFQNVGLFGVMSAHPFTAVTVALAALTAGYYLFRQEVVSTREQLEGLGESIDIDRIQRFASTIEELAASFARAREKGDLERQLSSGKAILDQLEAQADFLRAQQGKFGAEARVAFVDEQAKFDLERSLKEVEETLGLKVRVEFERKVIEREAASVGDDIRDNVIKQFTAGAGRGIGNFASGALAREIGLGRSSPLVPDASERSHLRAALSQVVPADSLEFDKLLNVDEADTRAFLDTIDTLGRTAGQRLRDAIAAGDKDLVVQLTYQLSDQLQPVIDEFLKDQKFITVGADNISSAFETAIGSLQGRLSDLEAERKQAEEANKAAAAPTTSRQVTESREALEEYLLTKREELRVLQETALLQGQSATRYQEQSEFKHLLATSNLEVTETEREFISETERLQKLLREGYTDPAKLEEFKSEMGRLLLLLEEYRAVQSAVQEESQALGSDNIGPSKELLKVLSEERTVFEATKDLPDAAAAALRRLSEAEKTVAEDKTLSKTEREETLSQIRREILLISELQEAQKVSAQYEADRESTRARAQVELESQEDQNRALKVQLDLLDATSDAQREEIRNNARLQAQQPRAQLRKTLEEINDEMLRALGLGKRLERELTFKQESKRRFASGVLQLEEQRVAIGDDTAAVGARSAPARRQLLEQQVRRRDRFDANELEKKSLEELIALYLELSSAVEEANNAKIETTAIAQLEDQIDSLRLTSEDRVVRDVLRGIPTDSIDRYSGRVRQLVRELDVLSKFRQLGADISRSFTDGLREAAFSGREFESIMEDVLRNVTAMIADAVVFRPIEEGLNNAIGGLFPDVNAAREEAALESPVGEFGPVVPAAFQGLEGSALPLDASASALNGAGTILITAASELAASASALAAAGATLGGASALSPVGPTGPIPVNRLGRVYDRAVAFATGEAWSAPRSAWGLARRAAATVALGAVPAFADGASFTFEHPYPDTTPHLSQEDKDGATNPWGSVRAFAGGNPFSNKIVDQPTYFDIGLMGEAGPEGIMPLGNTRSGKLGVHAFKRGGGEELAPIRRGPSGALGIDLDALIEGMQGSRFAVGDTFYGQRSDRVDARRFAVGGAFNSVSNRTQYSAHFDFGAPQEFRFGDTFYSAQNNATSLSRIFATTPRFEMGAGFMPRETTTLSVPEPFAVVTGGGDTDNSVTDASKTEQSVRITNHFHVAGAMDRDTVRRTGRMMDADLRDRTKRVFKKK